MSENSQNDKSVRLKVRLKIKALENQGHLEESADRTGLVLSVHYVEKELLIFLLDFLLD